MDEEEVILAFEKLEKFLKENPQMNPYQNKINRILGQLPEEARLGMIFYLLADSLEELSIELTILQATINGIKDKT
jgi:hypothetical protein